MGQLSGKCAWITGAGSGIGKAVLAKFLQEGAEGILAFDLDDVRLEELREEFGSSVVTCQGDVRNFSDNLRAVDLALQKFGRLDIFIGNAGVRDGRLKLSELSADQISSGFDEVMSVNVKGYFFGSKAAYPALVKNKGSIVLTLSTSSFYIGGGPIYIASKHAALGLMRALAHEFAPDIRVNGVAPGGTPTQFANAMALNTENAAQSGRSGGPSSNLLRHQFSADDHASAYALLASEQSRVITGTVIHSDGGRGVMLPAPQ
ncbi:MAG: SDR family oxidoreductase [Rhodospirillaceae bacterium]